MNSNALFGTGAVPLIAALIQVFKATGMPSRLAPAVALMLGIGAGLAALWPMAPGPIPWPEAVVLGITWGLAASGLYQGGKLAASALRAPPSTYAPPGSRPAPTALTAPNRPPVAAPSQPSIPTVAAGTGAEAQRMPGSRPTPASPSSTSPDVSVPVQPASSTAPTGVGTGRPQSPPTTSE